MIQNYWKQCVEAVFSVVRRPLLLTLFGVFMVGSMLIMLPAGQAFACSNPLDTTTDCLLSSGSSSSNTTTTCNSNIESCPVSTSDQTSNTCQPNENCAAGTPGCTVSTGPTSCTNASSSTGTCTTDPITGIQTCLTSQGTTTSLNPTGPSSTSSQSSNCTTDPITGIQTCLTPSGSTTTLTNPSGTSSSNNSGATSATSTGTDANACTDQNCLITRYVNPLIVILGALVGIVVATSIVVAGIQYSLARDDVAKVTAAKHRIYNAVIALVTYLFLFAFLQWLVPGGIL